MKPEKLLDIAFRQANRSGQQTKKSMAVRKEKRHIYADLERLKVAYGTINSFLMNQLESSNLDNLTEFNKSLMETLVDSPKMERDKKKIMNSMQIIKRLKNEFEMKIKFSDNKMQSNEYRKEFYGRLSSVVKKLDFDTIEGYTKELQTLPKIKHMDTILVAGYPNVGKSYLVKNLSGHKINIQPYPFTTKELLIGYMPHRFDTVQLIDTPGILDRPLEKRNKIELKAMLALKHITRNVIFIIDPSETCGYSLEAQENLLKEIKQTFKPKIMVIATKKDIPSEKKTESDLSISNQSKEDIELVHDEIIKFFFKG